jgi:hypothetical protein
LDERVEVKKTMGRVLPILFNTDMVLAILDGRKTVTRRVVKHPFEVHPNGYITKPRGNERLCPCEPPYQPGDILYIRETWAFLPCVECMDEGPSCHIEPVVYDDGDCESEGCFVYKASHPRPERVSWTPSIHMPKQAARIWLKVTDVRAERLRDIKNVHDEGIRLYDCPAGYTWKRNTDMYNCYTDSLGAMKALWDSTIPKRQQDLYSWNANPWVWVIGFERCEKPET